jgi:hypothetical protein
VTDEESIGLLETHTRCGSSLFQASGKSDMLFMELLIPTRAGPNTSSLVGYTALHGLVSTSTTGSPCYSTKMRLALTTTYWRSYPMELRYSAWNSVGLYLTGAYQTNQTCCDVNVGYTRHIGLVPHVLVTSNGIKRLKRYVFPSTSARSSQTLRLGSSTGYSFMIFTPIFAR